MSRKSTEVTPVIIGISGGTGSGKTTVAKKIVDQLPPGSAIMIQLDWYYRDQSQLDIDSRSQLNFDEPDALDIPLLIEHINGLKHGEAINCPQYDFASHERLDTVCHIQPHPIVVVEGILLFSDIELRKLFDLRLFVDTADDIRLMRRIKRDILQRDRSISSIQRQYYSTVRPMHQKYVAPSKSCAHLVIPEGGENVTAVDVIVGRLLYALWKMNALIPESLRN